MKAPRLWILFSNQNNYLRVRGAFKSKKTAERAKEKLMFAEALATGAWYSVVPYVLDTNVVDG